MQRRHQTPIVGDDSTLIAEGAIDMTDVTTDTASDSGSFNLEQELGFDQPLEITEEI